MIGGVAVVAALSLTAPALGRPATQIRIVIPAHAQRSKVYNVTVQGFSPVRARAYLFVDYSPCASTFAAEQHQASRESASYRVRGRFAQVSGWNSSAAGTDHACAYLVANSSGNVIASQKVSFQISGN
jgi:hypothetical protein